MTFKSEIIFVRILLPFVFGMMCGYSIVCDFKFILPIMVTSAICLFGLIFINYYYQALKAYYHQNLISLLIYFVFFVFGILICLLQNQSLRKNYYGHAEAEYFKIWVANEAQHSEGIIRFEAIVCTSYTNQLPKNANGKLLVVLMLDSSKSMQLRYGDVLLIPANSVPVEPRYNPGEFDYRAWLATKNIYKQVFINQKQVVKLAGNMGNPIIRYAIKVRQKQVDIYRKLIHNDEAFAVASTLVLGYRADLSKETLAAFSKTGTIHALSVSGAHVAIIYMLLNWALFFMDRQRILKMAKLLFISTLIWYYALLTGFSPSVLRAAIMISIYIFAKSFNQSSNAYNILAFTAFAILVYDPFLIWDVGFQLSFLAVFGLVYLQPKIYKWIDIENKWLDKLWSAVALSLAAQITTFPLSIYYFHQFPMYFIFGNLFILLPLMAIMYLGIMILVLRTYFLAPVFEWAINFTNDGLKWIAGLPFSGINAIWLTKWELILLTITLIALIISLAEYKKKLLIVAVLCLLTFQSMAAYQKVRTHQQKKVLFFSLRKHYAAAFITGKNAILITDLTLTAKDFDFSVKPALEQLQITHLHFVDWKQDTVINSLTKNGMQLSFNNYQVLLMDKKLDQKSIIGRPRFDLVWLHDNPKKSIDELNVEIDLSTLLIDATNTDWNIKKYKLEANKIQIEPYILKKNNSYLVDLNQR